MRDDVRKKWSMKGSKLTDRLMSQIIGFRCQVSGVRKASRKILKPCMKLHHTVELRMRFREAEQRTAEYRMTIDELLMSLRSALLNNKIERIP